MHVDACFLIDICTANLEQSENRLILLPQRFIKRHFTEGTNLCTNEMTHKFEPAVKCPAEATLVAGAQLNDLLYVNMSNFKPRSSTLTFTYDFNCNCTSNF